MSMASSTGKKLKQPSESTTTVGQTDPSAAAPSASGSARSSCEEALARVVQLARSVAEDSRETRRTLPSGRVRPEDSGSSEPSVAPASPEANARARLTAAFRALDPETALKIRTLMIAGRDGQSIGAVNVNLSLSDAEAGFAIMAADSGENGPLLIEYLRRGHALACAVGIDLDGPLTAWQSRSPDELRERAWLSFGKQLATSQPSDWQCLGIVEPGTQELSKLYVKLTDHAWWSFEAVLDRPTLAGVEKERRALGRRHLKGIWTNTLESLVGRLGSARGRALRRAGRAICARVGQVSEASAR